MWLFAAEQKVAAGAVQSRLCATLVAAQGCGWRLVVGAKHGLEAPFVVELQRAAAIWQRSWWWIVLLLLWLLASYFPATIAGGEIGNEG